VIVLSAWLTDNWSATFGSIVGGVLNAVATAGFEVYFETWAVWMDEYENHRTEQDFQHAHATKMFLFQVVNCYTALFMMAFTMDFITIGKWKPGCNGSCLSQTGSLAFSSMATQIVALNFMESILPYFQWKRNAEQMEKDFGDQGV